MKNKSKSASDIILKTEGVGVTYEGSIVALENVSLSIPAAKLTAILGPSGCGKTTLGKAIVNYFMFSNLKKNIMIIEL